MTTAVVFAYHNVGVRCLSVLLARDVQISLVVTHVDDPREQVWFDSVRELAIRADIPCVTPDDPNTVELVDQIGALRPDFLFSFYYRHMLKPPLLSIPRRGALNMHGSLLPKYRGRVPVNWAIIHGESETGATLHYMREKPDAGDIVDQQAVPILPDDVALDVFNKVTWAAELVLHRSLPCLEAGSVKATAQDLAQGSYFGGRKPEDGRIDWRKDAIGVHNLVRAVAPPYPGAFCMIAGRTLRILRTRRLKDRRDSGPRLICGAGQLLAVCADGSVLRILSADLDGIPIDTDAIMHAFGAASIPLI